MEPKSNIRLALKEVRYPLGQAAMRFGKGLVYFLRPGDIPKVKIGYTTNLAYRIKTLQTASCEILNVIGVFPNATLYLEMALHAKFKEYRLHNEWFSLCQEIQELIASSAKFPAYDFLGNWIGFFKTEQEAITAQEKKDSEFTLRQPAKKGPPMPESIKAQLSAKSRVYP